MTTFEDGPARGQTLMIQRAPRFLRVTQEDGKFDALDLMNDTPKPEEKLFVYEITGKPGMVHINRGRGRGGFYPMANYRLVPNQPADAVLRKFESWCAWCHAQSGTLAAIASPPTNLR